MITQTRALFIDAYRELNAKKLFWITLLLSGLVVLIYAAIGIDEDGISFLWFDLGFIPVTSEQMPAELLYKTVFLNLGLGIWLTWIATILALISTAGIIPDMIAGGSIEMLLSKPISRTRLFLTKYFAGLLFVTLQVSVFTVACMLVIGIRGGAWEPGLLLAIPLVVCFFSYLFGFCALIGVLTRSTIAALLVTLLFWFIVFILNSADAILLSIKTQAELQRDAYSARLENMEVAATRIVSMRMQENGEEVPDDFEPTEERIIEVMPWYADTKEEFESSERTIGKLKPWTTAVVGVKTALPKTGETIALLERALVSSADLELLSDLGGEEGNVSASETITPDEEPESIEISQDEANLRLQEEFRSRSPWWVLGTSLLFEAFVVGLAVLLFARRDP